ncbi:MAG: HAD family hydrolase [Phycisphaeraceae bacterium]
MQYQAVIFDLDGTLLDTLADLTAAVNHVLQRVRVNPIDTTACRRMIGNGARVLIQRALQARQIPVEPGELDRLLQQFLTYYARHKFDQTRPYEGVPHVLDTLTERGYRLAVLSNKPHPATVEMVNELLDRWHFDPVFGQRADVPLKPDPTAALMICETLILAPHQVAFVGDSGEDMATAKAAGMFAVGVTWGMREESDLRTHGADVIVHHPEQLLQVLV